jgi:hypothetical protein
MDWEKGKKKNNEKIEFSRKNAAENFFRWIPNLLWYHVKKHGIHGNKREKLKMQLYWLWCECYKWEKLPTNEVDTSIYRHY